MLVVAFLMALPSALRAQLRFITNNDAITITGYLGNYDIVIPASTNGYPVVAIRTGSFTSSGVTNIYIPYTVTNIAPNPSGSIFSGGTFYNNLNLKTINIDPANPVWSSVDGVWFNKDQTKLIQFPEAKTGFTIPNTVTNIGPCAFILCNDLTNVVIPNSVTTIATNAFQICNITNIVIPDNVTSIGDAAFYQCYYLRNINIPHSITNLGVGVFQDCHELTNASLPNSITCLPKYLFAGCLSLSYLTIPSSVTNGGDNVFWGTGLSGIFFQGNAPSYNNNAFYLGGSTPIVYYLPGTTNWGATWGAAYSGRPTALWNPEVQTADSSFGVWTNWLGFNITGTANIPIVVEACTNFGSAWIPLQSASLTNGSFYFSDPQWTNYSNRFYRIRSP